MIGASVVLAFCKSAPEIPKLCTFKILSVRPATLMRERRALPSAKTTCSNSASLLKALRRIKVITPPLAEELPQL